MFEEEHKHEGFNCEGFDGDFKFYGKMWCWNCVVPDAARLREDIERIEQSIRNNEEEMKWRSTRGT